MKIAAIMNLFLTMSISLLIQSNLYPQVNFEIMYGSSNEEHGVVVELTSDGGYIVGGSSNSFHNGDIDLYLIKIGSTGEIEWSKTYATFGNERIHGVKQAENGDYYLIAWMEGGFGFVDILMMKVDSLGNQIWAENFGGFSADEPRGLNITPDGEILVSGYVSSFGFGGKDIQIIKADNNGNIHWAKTFGTIFDDHNARNLITSNGNYLFTGETDFTGFLNWNPTLIKTDTSGNIIWAKRYPGNVEDWSRSVIELSSGGYVFAGNTQSYGSGQNDIYIVKTDTSGNVIWAKAIGSNQDDVGYSVTESSDGKIAVAGYTNSFGFGAYDVFLLKMDLDGTLDWLHTFGGLNDEFAFDLKTTPDNGFILTGKRVSDAIGGSDVYVVKTDASGKTECGFLNASPIVTDVPLNAVSANFGIVSAGSAASPTIISSDQSTNSNVLCRVIPVELGSYNSKIINNSVSLTWETVTETNNLGFEIRRDGEKIGFVNGNGTTTEKHDYDFTDKNLVPGKYEYEVIQIDFDGTRDELFKIMVDVNNIPNEFSLSQNYPNPFNPSTKITYTIANQSQVILKVYNSLGTEVKTLVNKVQPPGFYYVNFDGASLSSGVYFYTIRAGNHVSSKKMILLR